MPRGDCAVRDEFILKCGTPMNWALITNELPDNEPSLINAFSALSISRVGQENNDGRLARESTKLYGKALKDLQSALYDAERMHSDSVLTAIMLLGLYEGFENSILHSKSWVTHAKGAAHLIELRGPERHQNRQAHNVFLGSRIPTIYAAIMQRRHTYLAAREWLTVPWTYQHRTYFDRLIDIAAAIPGLLERVDAADLGHIDDLLQVKRLQLLQEIKTTQEEMDQWRKNMKATAKPQTADRQVNQDIDSQPFDSELLFTNHMFVHAYMFYVTCSLVLCQTFNNLQDTIQSKGRKNVKYPQGQSEEERLDALRFAIDIVRTIPYCIQSEMGALGSTIMHFPANLAYRYFSDINNIAVTDWLTKIFDYLNLRGKRYNLNFNAKARGSNSNSPPPEVPNTAISSKNPSVKSDSVSDEPSEGLSSPNASSSPSNYTMAFVYENPSKYYIDTTGQG